MGQMDFFNFLRYHFYTSGHIFILLYGGVLGVFAALLAFIIGIPCLLISIENMHNEFNNDFKDIKNMTEKMWIDLMEMELKSDMQKLRMYRREASHYTNAVSQFGGYIDEYDKVEPSGYGVPAPSIAAPKYGYGCCALYPERYFGGLGSLEVSFKCPVGAKGQTGSDGAPGDPGYDGHPGILGEDYPTVPAGHKSGYGIPSAFSDYIQNPQPYCEPCPRGNTGQQGAKGRPGIRGDKGHRGNSGRHGIHGIPGNAGPIGETGPRGRSGRAGVPGPHGADGVRGAKGARGAIGTPGAVGIPGQRGTSGPTGSMGPEGRRGPIGVPGIKGQSGMDGIGGNSGGRGSPGQDGIYCQCPEKTHAVSYYEQAPQPSNDYQPFENLPINPPALPDDYLNQPVNNEATIYSINPTTSHYTMEQLKYAKPVYIRNGVSNSYMGGGTTSRRPMNFNHDQIQVPPASQTQAFVNSFSAPEFTDQRNDIVSDVSGGGGSFDLRAAAGKTRVKIKPIFTSSPWPFVTPLEDTTYGLDVNEFRIRNRNQKRKAQSHAKA